MLGAETSQSQTDDLCWTGGVSWFKCCAPWLGPNGDLSCWSESYSYDRCCLSSPEVEPMESDLAQCRNDPALRLMIKHFRHAEVGLRSDCVSQVGCRATSNGWIFEFQDEPMCDAKELEQPALLDPSITAVMCQALAPLSSDVWYDADAYEEVHLRYRFGSVKRSHCAVPNWRLLQEEPLRFYSLLNSRSKSLSRVLVDIGAGDAGWDDPIGGILTAFAGAGIPWRGVYFEAIPENCAKAADKLKATGNITLHCGYVTPASVTKAISDEFGMKQDASCSKSDPDCSGRRPERIEVDAMSIDIDSYDCSVLREALLLVNPKLLVVEISALPPPLIVSAEFHPIFQSTEVYNVSGASAIAGATGRGEGFWAGCSLSAVIALLWPFGLGLYRLAARDAMFIRADAADEAGLAAGDGPGGWQPADEFECWRSVCADAGLNENWFQLLSEGVHSHAMPRIWEIVQQRKPRHPLTVGVATPPPAPELPRVRPGWRHGVAQLSSTGGP